jgi:hypothetical protein
MFTKTRILVVTLLVAGAMVVTGSGVNADDQVQPVPEAQVVMVADGCTPCCVPPPVKMVLKAKDPCTCCWIDVCVCVPGCCTGEPCCVTRCGFFGRVITQYTWCCGHTVEIVVTRHGRVIVR